jgi:hypothetical protein
MKALKNNQYSHLEVSKEFNKIILNDLPNYNGKKKQQLKSYLEDLRRGGCQSGMVNEFIYHADCKEFYINHIDELEEIRQDMEDSLGQKVENKQELPHYTFMCWLCFEEYCYSIYISEFES